MREGIITSESVNSLSWPEEVFYRRLLSVVDDYGRYHGNPSLLRAACYPLQIDKVGNQDIAKWLTACVRVGLVRAYTVDGKPYIEVVKFGQQIRTNKSKFPATDGALVKSFPDEADIEAALETHISLGGKFFNLAVSKVRRQQRIGESYIDLLLDTDAGPCVVELKRGNTTGKHLAQICRYTAAVAGSFGVLIGAAVGPNLRREDAKESGIALAEFTDGLKFSVVLPNDQVNSCDFTVNHGKSYEHLDVDVDVDGVEDVGGNANSSRKNGARHALPPDESPIVASLPLREGGEYQVHQSLVAELEPIYPNVDVPKTLLEMRGWLLLNDGRRKTRKGIKRFIGNWLQGEEEKHGGQG
ncbi:MAG: hypothetical protein U1E51_18685 [Candidatus Binatia bacterium]|nr:hypothetical protein [Candidatus Binatia bacterium]